MSQLGLHSIGTFNWRENRKLSTSVNNIQREHDRKIRRLSVEKSKFVSRATSRMMQLVKTSLNEKENTGYYERNRSAKQDVTTSIRNISSSSSNILLQNSMARVHSKPPLPKLILTKPQTSKKKSTNSCTSKLENSPVSPKLQESKNLLRSGKRDSMPQSSSKLQPQRSHRISMSFSIHPQSVSRQSILEPSSRFLLMQRRQSCPNLGWYSDRILASGRTEPSGKDNLGKQMEGMRKCRYLRLPSSPQD